MRRKQQQKKTKKKVLIVEDERALSDVLKVKLEKEGYEVEVSEDGGVGYERIKKWKPDLVLLDIIMPKMDGYRVLGKMKEEDMEIPVIIISNSGQPVELEKTKKLGAVDHLIKTQFEPEEVVEKVSSHLKEQRERDKKKKNNSKADDPSENEQKNRDPEVKVLVVEDDSFLRDLIVRELAKNGFTVFEAVDGEKALDRVESVVPDIVILDIILPGTDGFDVLEKIKEDKEKKIREIPVLILSNLGEKNDINKAKEIGAHDYMVKAHFTTKEITKKIKETLNID